MDAYDKEVMKRPWTRRMKKTGEVVGGLILWAIVATTIYAGCIVFE